jgi:anti-sigma factor RsiW
MMHVTDRLQRYLDGEMHAGDAREVAAHLEVCAVCRQECAALSALWQSVASAVTTTPAVSVWPTLAARRTGRRRAASSPWLRGGLAMAALAAGLMLGLGAHRGAGTRSSDAFAGDGEDGFLQTQSTLDQIWWSAGTQDDWEVGS